MVSGLHSLFIPSLKFIDEQILSDIKEGIARGSLQEKKGLVLAISESSCDPAKALLKQPELNAIAENNSLSWESISTDT